MWLNPFAITRLSYIKKALEMTFLPLHCKSAAAG